MIMKNENNYSNFNSKKFLYPSKFIALQSNSPNNRTSKNVQSALVRNWVYQSTIWFTTILYDVITSSNTESGNSNHNLGWGNFPSKLNWVDEIGPLLRLSQLKLFLSCPNFVTCPIKHWLGLVGRYCIRWDIGGTEFLSNPKIDVRDI